MADRSGGGGFVSPYTGEVFTSQFAFNDHMARWPEVCEANGWNLDGTPKAAAKSEAADKPASKAKAKSRK